jgi:hypothetical protein
MSPEQARADMVAFLRAGEALREILAGMTEFTGHVPMTDDPELVSDVLLRGSDREPPAAGPG